jgi:DNA polymerase III epsilon subunit-like protein
VDIETSSASISTAQILQIAGLMLDPRTLEIKDGFCSYIKPENWDTVEPGALAVNKLNHEILDNAPDIKLVFQQFCAWVGKYNRGNSTYTAPIMSGYNILGFDLPIISRFCERFGPWDAKSGRQKLFNQVNFFDLYYLMLYWNENNPELPKLKLSIVLEYMGMSTATLENSHDALFDCKMCHQMLVKLFTASRYLTKTREETGTARLQFKNCLRNKEEK